MQILHQNVSYFAENDNSRNYLLVIETNNFIPQRTYLVDMKNFHYYDETMPFYVINQN
jgi:hypothetical protein